MATQTIGRIGLGAQGEFSASATYNKLDAVTYNGNSYVYVGDDPSTGVTPSEQNGWMLLAQAAAQEPSWIYPTLTNGTTPAAYGAGRMRYMKMGNHVFVAGSINIKPGSNLVLFTLPAGYRPAANTTATVLRPCSGSRIARIAVYGSNGSVNLEWVKNISDASSYTSASIWVECSIDFWAISD